MLPGFKLQHCLLFSNFRVYLEKDAGFLQLYFLESLFVTLVHASRQSRFTTNLNHFIFIFFIVLQITFTVYVYCFWVLSLPVWVHSPAVKHLSPGISLQRCNEVQSSLLLPPPGMLLSQPGARSVSREQPVKPREIRIDTFQYKASHDTTFHFE